MVKRIFLIILFLWSMQGFLSAEPASDFCLSDLDNAKVCLSAFKGRPVLLFFWTTWCPFCHRELALLNDKYAQLSEDNFELLAIDVGEPFYRVDNFIRTNLDYRVLLDEDMSVAQAYELLGVPTYVLIDKDGLVRFKGHLFPEDKYKDLISE